MSKIGNWEACGHPYTPGMACYRRSLGEGRACVLVDEDGCGDFDADGARAWNLFEYGSRQLAGGIANAMAQADAVLVAAGLLAPARALTVADAEALTAPPPGAPDAWGEWKHEMRQRGTSGPMVDFWSRTASDGRRMYAAERCWGSTFGHRGNAADVDSARAAADAQLVEWGWLDPARAFVGT